MNWTFSAKTSEPNTMKTLISEELGEEINSVLNPPIKEKPHKRQLKEKNSKKPDCDS